MPDSPLSDSFVVRTQQNRERWAAENVFRAGFAYYLPQVRETVRVVHRGVRRREFQVKPLFPGYLFVSAEGGQWHDLLKAFGVLAIVTTSDKYPAIIRGSVLEAIRALGGSDGNIVLPKANKLVPGDTARITYGSYAGYTGLVQGTSVSDRQQILLDYMGRKVPFLVREAHLERVA